MQIPWWLYALVSALIVGMGVVNLSAIQPKSARLLVGGAVFVGVLLIFAVARVVGLRRQQKPPQPSRD